MKKLNIQPVCPNCQGGLSPKVMTCHDCDLEIKGGFAQTPLAHLTPSQMQFLQTFVLCEGKITELERALNISYPTVKSRLKDLKQQLLSTMEPGSDPIPQQQPQTAAKLDPVEVLRRLEAGEVSYEEAIEHLRNKTKE